MPYVVYDPYDGNVIWGSGEDWRSAISDAEDNVDEVCSGIRYARFGHNSETNEFPVTLALEAQRAPERLTLRACTPALIEEIYHKGGEAKFVVRDDGVADVENAGKKENADDSMAKD